MTLEKILLLLRSLSSLIILNLTIFSCKKKGKKTILFCYPNYKLKNISNYYIEDLLDLKKEFKVIFITTDKKDIKKNEIFIYNNLIKYLIKVDLFISNYVCDFFPEANLKSYIHHDIYDTPLSSLSEEKRLKKRLDKYDHILIPSINSKKIFERLNLKKQTKFFEIGYHKLSFLKKTNKKVKKKNKSNSIIIAPTNFLSFPKLSIYNKIDKIIGILLFQTNFKIIFRPHPSNANSKKVKIIEDKFCRYKSFQIDKSKNYFKSYSNSFLMITDISGTAYTYSFLTFNPVIFFSVSKKMIKKNRYDILSYFKNRNNIGFVVDNEKKLIQFIHRSKITNIKR